MIGMKARSQTGRAASATYRIMARELNKEAARQDREHRPLTARRTRFMASIAMRAAWAEELDEQPAGLE